MVQFFDAEESQEEDGGVNENDGDEGDQNNMEQNKDVADDSKNNNKNSNDRNTNNRNSGSKVSASAASPPKVGSLTSNDKVDDNDGSDADAEVKPDYDDRRRPLKEGHTFGMLPHPRIDKYGMSPLPLSHIDIVNLHDESQAWGLVSPPHSAVVYRVSDVQNVFLALLILQVRDAVSFVLRTGEWCLCVQASAAASWSTLPAVVREGQRMYGSIG